MFYNCGFRKLQQLDIDYWTSKVFVHASRSFNTLLMSLDLNLPDTLQYRIYKLQTTVGFITLLISKNVI